MSSRNQERVKQTREFHRDMMEIERDGWDYSAVEPRVLWFDEECPGCPTCWRWMGVDPDWRQWLNHPVG